MPSAAPIGPVPRHRDRRLAGHVELRRVLQQVGQAAAALGVREPAEGRGRPVEHRGEQEIETAGPPLGQPPAVGVEPVGAGHVVRGGDGTADGPQGGVVGLELVVGDRDAQPLLPCGQVDGDGAGHDAQSGGGTARPPTPGMTSVRGGRAFRATPPRRPGGGASGSARRRHRRGGRGTRSAAGPGGGRPHRRAGPAAAGRRRGRRARTRRARPGGRRCLARSG